MPQLTVTGTNSDAPDANALASSQPQDEVRACLDPAGHPFRLFL